MMNDAPIDEQAAQQTAWASLRSQGGWFGLGVGVGCLSLFLLIEAVPFVSYPKLAAALAMAGVLSVFPRGRQLLKFGVAATALLSALILFTPVVDWSVDALDVAVAPRKADVLVVLGAGIHCGAGNLDATSIARTTKGLALWRSGFAPEITVSDGDRSILGRCPSQAQVTQEFIDSLLGSTGPPVVVLRNMRTTSTEANAIAKLQVARKWKTVMIVTSPTHSRRALRTFRRAGVNAFVVAADEPNFDTGFGHPVDRLRAVAPAFRELAGMIKNRIAP